MPCPKGFKSVSRLIHGLPPIIPEDDIVAFAGSGDVKAVKNRLWALADPDDEDAYETIDRIDAVDALVTPGVSMTSRVGDAQVCVRLRKE
jgi:hypothetical protein